MGLKLVQIREKSSQLLILCTCQSANDITLKSETFGVCVRWWNWWLMKRRISREQVALVTGVGRKDGLGFAICKDLAIAGFKVILTARNLKSGKALSNELRDEGLDVEFLSLNVKSPSSLEDANAYITKKYGRLDVLVNNAGGFYDHEQTASKISGKELNSSLSQNLHGTVNCCLVFIPLLRQSKSPKIVNVSTQIASLNRPWGARDGSNPLFAISKAALNAFTCKLADELRKEKFLVNAVCPGWIATYPGMAEMGARSVAKGSKSVVWACTLPENGPTGGFFRDGAKIEW